jgi:regulator of ribonuclease activity A
MSISTPDLFDANRDCVCVAHQGFKQFGGMSQFSGQAVTVSCPMDNSLAVEAIKEPGEGKVLVIDAGNNPDYAFLGDIMAEKAIRNHWAGIIINGCVRDIEILRTMPIGVMALGVIPRSTVKKGVGLKDIPVACHGLTVHPGDYLYADENGLLLSKQPLC